jgi:hypothetical protein
MLVKEVFSGFLMVVIKRVDKGEIRFRVEGGMGMGMGSAVIDSEGGRRECSLSRSC